MKNLFFVLLGTLFLVGCVTGVEKSVLPSTNLIVPTAPVATAEISDGVDVAEAAATAVPPTLASANPQFSNLQFRQTPSALTQTVFDGGTEEVFAAWTYVNLSSSDVVRRVWTKNGAAWLEREEIWDVATYGSLGTINDISIYDFEGSGLEPGRYQLTLYLNDVYQTEAPFEVKTAVSATDLATSTETQLAWVDEQNILMLDAWDGTQRELARANKIVELLWLSDGQHLLYVDQKEETDPNAPPWPKHALWIINTENGEQWQLGSYEENLRRISLMPGNRFIVTIPGSDYGDACGMDRSLSFVALDDRYQRIALHNMRDFAGISTDLYGFFPEEMGKWVSDHEYDVSLTAYCMSPEMGTSEEDMALIGQYRFDLNALTAVKIDS